MITQIISAIIQLIFSLINFIIVTIIKLISSIIPIFGLGELTTVFELFFGLLEGAFNMTYFILGDMTYFFRDVIIILFTLKHVVLPIVNFTRKVIIK